MGRGLIICLWLVLGGILFSLKAQQHQEKDPPTQKKAAVDSTFSVVEKKKVMLADSLVYIKQDFKPDPTRAVVYSAIFPGLGQIYNRRYWKLPLVYGGFVGLTYAISWNGSLYNDYSQAYRDLVTNTGTTWHDFLRPGQTVETVDREALKTTLRRQKDFFRRNRDLAIIATVGFYALCMIDAYVDAQLYDFDISPDLSMRVEPVIWGPSQHMKPSIGIQCSINF